MIKFNCSRCNAAIEAASSKAGMAGDCPSCQELIIIPDDPSAQRETAPQAKVVRLVPKTTRWTDRKRGLFSEICGLKARLESYLAHQDQFFCFQCDSWVEPFFDYERRYDGGIALSNHGMTFFRQNTSLHEHVRCRNCGKLLNVSGALMAQQAQAKIHAADEILSELDRHESRWLKLNELAKTRPYLAMFLRLRALWIALLLLLSIYAVVRLAEHQTGL